MTLPDRQVPDLHHRRVGEAVVTMVSDGFLEGSLAVMRGIGVEESTRMLRAAFRPVPRRTSVNRFLVRTPGHATLIDCGCGPAIAPTGCARLVRRAVESRPDNAGSNASTSATRSRLSGPQSRSAIMSRFSLIVRAGKMPRPSGSLSRRFE